MKFTVRVDGFLEGITPAAEVSSKVAIKDFDSLYKINIETDKNYIKVSSFNGGMAVVSELSNASVKSLDYKPDIDGNATVSSKDLLAILMSFEPDREVIFEVKKNSQGSRELQVILETDQEQYQTLPIFSAPVSIPKMASEKNGDFAKTVEIPKGLLDYGFSNVKFALGFEASMPLYKHIAITASNDTLRFGAGTGARHAISIFEGTDVAKSSAKECSFLFQGVTVPSIQKVLKSCVDDTIKIMETKKKDGVVFQTVIESVPHKIVLVGLDHSLKWIDEGKILDLDYPIKMVLNVEDLKYAAKGTWATYNEDARKDKKPHKAELSFDIAKKHISIKSQEKMRSCRKVAIIDSEVEAGVDGDVFMICMSAYLKEVVDIACSDRIQLEAIGPKNAIVVTCYAGDKVSDRSSLKNKDERGFEEKLIMLFATHAK